MKYPYFTAEPQKSGWPLIPTAGHFGADAAAKGLKICSENLRRKFPNSQIIVTEVLPAHAPGNRFYDDIKKTHAALDTLNLGNTPNAGVLKLWGDFVKPDGTLKQELFTSDNIHLSPAGYDVYAAKLKPLIDEQHRK